MCGILCLVCYDKGSFDLQRAPLYLNLLEHRGPDGKSERIIRMDDDTTIYLGFTRLAIMDVSDSGLQPFYDEIGNHVICNGEIYNYRYLADKYNIDLKTTCDCEIILPLYKKIGFTEMVSNNLDAEFAMVLYSAKEKRLYASRDRYGVRPLYYGYSNTKKVIGIASELKALHPIMEFVEQLKPNRIIKIDLEKRSTFLNELIEHSIYFSYGTLKYEPYIDNITYIHEQIRTRLERAVIKRLVADKPIGFLLSGGLDSSLVVAIATRVLGPEKMVCFTIGFEGSPDVEAAKKVVAFLGIKKHHIVPFTVDSGMTVLHEVIKAIESYDVTTIRASVPQYIISKYISEKTDVKVILSGEGADEICGSYRYFRDAPNAKEFHNETIRLLKKLCYFDNQRTDRTMAAYGLEVRVPYLDFEYVEFITRINPYYMMYRNDNMEKQLIRDSFCGYLPGDILYRSKEAFSDAVSSNEINWAQSIQAEADRTISDNEFHNAKNKYQINIPLMKDGLLFRKIFEKYYPNRDNVLPYYWLPKFQREIILDPSAKILKCY
jgi:asparagine synthase (glutamine-hydrolysing)